MSKIDKLIKQLCPDGIAYLPLGEVGEFFRGRRFVKDDILESGVPAIHYGELYTKYSISADKTFSYISEELASKLRFAKPGDVILVSAGETIADIGKSIAWLGTDDVVIHDALYGYRSELNPKYVSYFFNSTIFRVQLPRFINSSKISAISPQNLSKIEIPIPPLEIQNEIVEILDTFTELEAELEAELDARKKQYEFYRNRLLSFTDAVEGGVRWIPMGEVCEISWGNTSITKSSYLESGDGFLAYSAAGPDGLLPHFEFDREAVILSAIGARCGKTYFANGKWTCIKNTIYIYSKDESLLNKFLFWYTNREEFWFRSSSAQPFITMGDVKKLLIPIPDLGTQKRVVSALDAFDGIIADIEKGLPAEIASRRQQYEYYRNKLLTFKELRAS